MSELENFETYTVPDFDPIQSAATLLKATNALDDTELDIATLIKRLRFDAAEAERRMDTLTEANHEQLAASLGSMDATRRLMADVITPLADRVAQAYARISAEVVEPYYNAVELQAALARAHETLALMRTLAFFLMLLQQLLDCEKSLDGAADNRDVVRLARLHKQVVSFYKNDDMALGDVLALKLVRDYNSQAHTKAAALTDQLVTLCSQDLGHHSSFTADNTTLQNNLLALGIMDLAQLTSVIDRGAMAKSINISLSLLSRLLQSPRVLAAAYTEVQKTATTFSQTLTALLRNCKTHDGSLLEQFESRLAESDKAAVSGSVPGSSVIEEVYWHRLAFKFKKAVAMTMARGGPIARKLRSNYAQIIEAANSSLQPLAANHICDALSIINNES